MLDQLMRCSHWPTNRTDKIFVSRHKKRRPTVGDMNRPVEKAAIVGADFAGVTC